MQVNFLQLKKIMSLSLNDKNVKKTFEQFMSGSKGLNTQDAIETLLGSSILESVIEILTKKKANEIDAVEGIRVITDFFQYILSNSDRLMSMLGSFGLKANLVPVTVMQDSKKHDSK